MKGGAQKQDKIKYRSQSDHKKFFHVLTVIN